MKYKALITVIGIVNLLTMSACTSNYPTEDNTPIYNTPVKTIATEPVISDKALNELSANIFTDFSGIGEAASSENNQHFTKNNSMTNIICHDENGVIYYVNYGMFEDNYLYSYNNGEITLLVDKITNFVNYYNGKLYFLVDDTAPERFPWSWGGQLYSYDISTGTIEMILDKNIYNLCIQNDTFYFCSERYIDSNGNPGGNEWYSMKIGDSAPQKLNRQLPFFYGKYQLAFSDDSKKCRLILTDGEDEIVVADSYDYRNSYFSICDGSLWVGIYDSDNIPSVARIDLTNGNQKLYRTEKETKSGFEMDTSTSVNFAVLHGQLYAVSQSVVYVYNEKDDGFEPLLKVHYNASHIFADGDFLYAVIFDGEPYNYHTNDILKIDVKTRSVEVITN